MEKNFDKEKFQRIFRSGSYDTERKHSKELKELNEKFARNNTFSSGISIEARSELKQTHYKEILDIWIKSVIESFGNKIITPDDEKEIIDLMRGMTTKKVEHEQNGLRSMMASFGIEMGSILSSAQSSILNKLYITNSISLDKLKVAIDIHNEKNKKLNESNIIQNSLRLEEEQIDILNNLIEAHRNVNTSRRTEFIVTRDATSDSIAHPGFTKGFIDVSIVDLRMLDNSGLIKIFNTDHSQMGFTFILTPLSFQYYEQVKNRSVDPVKRIEEEILRYIDFPSFEKRYLKAFKKWKEAEKLLWTNDIQINLSTVGHLCREAVQEFLDVLIKRHGLENECDEKDKTKNRVLALIEKSKENCSETILKLLKKLFEFWETLNDVIQRQEHLGLKEQEAIVFDDAKRVVIYTLLIMKEMDQLFFL